MQQKSVNIRGLSIRLKDALVGNLSFLDINKNRSGYLYRPGLDTLIEEITVKSLDFFHFVKNLTKLLLPR